MIKVLLSLAAGLLGTGTLTLSAAGSITVRLATSVPSPRPVGTAITLQGSATDTGSGPITYKYEVQPPGSTGFSLLQDFTVSRGFVWAPTTTDGTYTLRATARDYLSGLVSVPVTKSFTLTSLVAGAIPVVTATANPLVALFSAPGCPLGSFMRVDFFLQGNNPESSTDFRPCVTSSMNFLIAGMLASSTYVMNYDVATGTTITPDPNQLLFATGIIPSGAKLPSHQLLVPASGATSTAEKVVLNANQATFLPFATDLSNNVIWYCNRTNIFQVTRPVVGGTIMTLLNGPGTGTSYWPNVTQQQILAEIDLSGNIVRETTAARISEQIPISDMPVGLDRLSHEARKLPNGNYLVLGETQQVFPTGTQGFPEPVTLIGPVVLILDPNFQLVWYWNGFDHLGPTQLDPNRAPALHETCVDLAGGGTTQGCPPVLLTSPASEWQHANSLQLLSDGSILMSARDQDWIYKIDYGNGTGTNTILWRMGKGGDFTFLNTTDSYPWFSGQHDPEFLNNGLSVMTVFDDGNTRVADGGQRFSRGQVLNVDESALTVSFVLNADLGVLSYALGSAAQLSNGDYYFDAGEIQTQGGAQLIEVNSAGTQTFNEEVGDFQYRSFRLTDFYNVPQVN